MAASKGEAAGKRYSVARPVALSVWMRREALYSG